MATRDSAVKAEVARREATRLAAEAAGTVKADPEAIAAAEAAKTAEVMKDAMHCVPEDADAWKGSQNEDARKTHLSWYLKHLIHYLQCVDEATEGYVGAGYVTIYSLLTSAMVMGNDDASSWAVAPSVRFDGNTLAHVLDHGEE
eukprot:6985717-Heterocapsa_arctica.AAC.1